MQFQKRRRSGRGHLRLINGLGSSETDALAMQAGAAYLTGGASAAGGYGSGGGKAPAAASSLPTMNPTTTVSPNIQTAISPQISPVFQQSSGGGDQTASTYQYSGGGQSGQGGGSGVPAGSAPNYGSPLTSAAPLPLVGTTGTPQLPWQPSGLIAQQSSPNWLLWGVALAAVGTALYVLWPDSSKKG